MNRAQGMRGRTLSASRRVMKLSAPMRPFRMGKNTAKEVDRKSRTTGLFTLSSVRTVLNESACTYTRSTPT